MSETNSVAAIYETHTQAEKAVKELQKSEFDMKKMLSASIITPTSIWLDSITPGQNGAFRGGIWGWFVRRRFLRRSRHRDPLKYVGLSRHKHLSTTRRTSHTQNRARRFANNRE